MLKKLIKHDFLAQKRILQPILLSVLIAGIGSGLLTFIIHNIGLSDRLGWLYFFLVILSAYYCFLSIAVTAICTYVYYYKNLMTDEGYLSHTLPVTATQQICSKFVTSLIWQLISVICAVASYAVMSLLLTLTFGSNDQFIYFFKILQKIFFNISVYLTIDMRWFWLVLLTITDSFATVFMVYLAISIGTISALKHKVLASIAFVFALNVARVVVTQTFLAFFEGILANNMDLETMIVTSFLNIVIAIVCFVFTKSLMEKKLNI